MYFIFDSSHVKGNGFFFDGVSVQSDCIITSDTFDPNKHPSLLKQDPTGEFVLIEWDNESIKIHTDILGYYSIFYITVGDRLLVSNSFRALSHYYKAYISSFLTLNVNFIVPLLLSNNNFFHTPYLNETSAREILLLPTGKYLLKNKKNISLETASIIDDLHNKNYSELIERGIENVIKKLNFLDKLYDENLKVVYLSGGKDSRAVLAFIQASNLKKKLYIYSQEPEKFQGESRGIIENDLKVANKLCTLFSFKKINKHHFSSLLEKELEQSVEDSIRDYFDFYSNIKYRFQPVHKKIMKMQSHLEFQGLSGEVYRTYWSPYYRRFSIASRIGNSWQSLRKDLQLFYQTFVQTKIVSKEIYDESRRYFISKVAEIEEGQTFYEKMDAHYNLFRNKFHFGGNLYSFTIGKYRFSPLIDINFLSAANKLSREQKEAGKLLFDIIDKISPYLNLIPFDNGATWEAGEHKSEIIDDSVGVLDLPSLTKEDFVSLKNVELACDKASRVSTLATVSSIDKRSLPSLDSIFEYMLSFLAENDKFFTPALIEHCRVNYKKGGVNKYIIFGKLVSISDIYHDAQNVNYQLIK